MGLGEGRGVKSKRPLPKMPEEKETHVKQEKVNSLNRGTAKLYTWVPSLYKINKLFKNAFHFPIFPQVSQLSDDVTLQ